MRECTVCIFPVHYFTVYVTVPLVFWVIFQVMICKSKKLKRMVYDFLLSVSHKKKVSEWLLFNAKWFFQLFHNENKLSWFVLLSLFLWPLYYPSFFALWLLITPLVSTDISSYIWYDYDVLPFALDYHAELDFHSTRSLK
jgi:hypothetical protein